MRNCTQILRAHRSGAAVGGAPTSRHSRLQWPLPAELPGRHCLAGASRPPASSGLTPPPLPAHPGTMGTGSDLLQTRSARAPRLSENSCWQGGAAGHKMRACWHQGGQRGAQAAGARRACRQAPGARRAVAGRSGSARPPTAASKQAARRPGGQAGRQAAPVIRLEERVVAHAGGGPGKGGDGGLRLRPPALLLRRAAGVEAGHLLRDVKGAQRAQRAAPALANGVQRGPQEVEAGAGCGRLQLRHTPQRGTARRAWLAAEAWRGARRGAGRLRRRPAHRLCPVVLMVATLWLFSRWRSQACTTCQWGEGGGGGGPSRLSIGGLGRGVALLGARRALLHRAAIIPAASPGSSRAARMAGGRWAERGARQGGDQARAPQQRRSSTARLARRALVPPVLVCF